MPRSNGLNAFETTLTTEVQPSDLVFPVNDTTGVASPAYITLEPNVPERREYVFMDGVFDATNFRTSVVGNRYRTGSAESGPSPGIVHPVGAVVRYSPVQQHLDDLWDDAEADATALTTHEGDPDIHHAQVHAASHLLGGGDAVLPQPLHRNVLSVAAASISIADADLTGLLADWESLRLTVQGSHDGTPSFVGLALRFNDDVGSNYLIHRRGIDGTDVSAGALFSAASTSMSFGQVGEGTNLTSRHEVTIVGHSRSDRRTAIHSVGHATIGSNGADNRIYRAFGLWQVNTVATKLTVLAASGLLRAGTLVMLEGLARR